MVMLLRNSELQKQIEDDKQKKDKNKRIQEIRKSVLDALERSTSLNEFEKKSKSQLQELEKLDIVQRHKLDVKIKKLLFPERKEWLKNYNHFPDPNPNRKKSLADLIFYSEYKIPKFDIPEKFRFEDFQKSELLLKQLELLILNKEIFENTKELLKNNPGIYYLANFISFTLYRHYQRSSDELISEVQTLKDDRISLYEELIKEINSSSLKENEKNKLIKKYEKEIDLLNSKIVVPKSYDKDNLANYFFDVAKQKKGNPSSRDLAKASDWNKDKWSLALKNDYRLIGNIFMILQEAKGKNIELAKEDWFNILYREYQLKFAEIQKRESLIQKKSIAKNYNDNISDDNLSNKF